MTTQSFLNGQTALVSLGASVPGVFARGVAAAANEGNPRNKTLVIVQLAGGIEAMVLYLRNDVILPNVGHHGEGYVPFCLTAFFMILFCNLLGLFPYMATATGNISVTATLAILSFLMIEIAGMRAFSANRARIGEPTSI